MDTETITEAKAEIEAKSRERAQEVERTMEEEMTGIVSNASGMGDIEMMLRDAITDRIGPDWTPEDIIKRGKVLRFKHNAREVYTLDNEPILTVDGVTINPLTLAMSCKVTTYTVDKSKHQE